jgi:hypothetical protein
MFIPADAMSYGSVTDFVGLILGAVTHLQPAPHRMREPMREPHLPSSSDSR